MKTFAKHLIALTAMLSIGAVVFPYLEARESAEQRIARDFFERLDPGLKWITRWNEVERKLGRPLTYDEAALLYFLTHGEQLPRP